MEQNIWKNAFGKLEMSTESKEKIWKKLEQKEEEKELTGKVSRNKKRQKTHLRKWIAAAICICFLGITFMEVYMDGTIVDAIQKIWKIEKSSEKVIEHTTDYHVTLDGYFAPELIECSEKRLIFASSMGVVIYDKERKNVVGTIDLQEIESNFLFEFVPITTRFLQEEDQLTIYNQKKGKVQGDCYVYDLTQCSSLENGGIAVLQPIKITPATDELVSEWKEKMKKFQKSTYSKEFKNVEDVICERYSKHSLRWKTADGEEYSSCLVLADTENADNPTDNKYVVEVFDKNLKTGQIKKEVLELKVDVSDPTTEEKLPEYEYTGDDMIQKALVDCARDNLKVYVGYGFLNPGAYFLDDSELIEDAVTLPIINIYQVKEGKKYIKVYGKFNYIRVVQYGYMLYDVCYCDGEHSRYGGSLACAYLKKTSDGYEVKKIVQPGDGALLLENMIEMCDGDEELAEELVNTCAIDDKKTEMIRVLKEYVKMNQLDIKYCKIPTFEIIEFE